MSYNLPLRYTGYVVTISFIIYYSRAILMLIFKQFFKLPEFYLFVYEAWNRAKYCDLSVYLLNVNNLQDVSWYPWKGYLDALSVIELSFFSHCSRFSWCCYGTPPIGTPAVIFVHHLIYLPVAECSLSASNKLKFTCDPIMLTIRKNDRNS